MALPTEKDWKWYGGLLLLGFSFAVFPLAAVMPFVFSAVLGRHPGNEHHYCRRGWLLDRRGIARQAIRRRTQGEGQELVYPPRQCENSGELIALIQTSLSRVRIILAVSSLSPYQPEAGMSPTERAPRVLIADDDPQGVELLEAYLSDSGYELQTASDGEETLRKVRDWQPDLVLLDIMMPRISGFQVCKSPRRSPDPRHRGADDYRAGPAQRHRPGRRCRHRGIFDQTHQQD